MAESGRLPPAMRFATFRPCSSGTNEKSVSSLLSRKPRTMIREPKAFSIVVVMASALPARSMIEMWLVEGSSGAALSPRSSARLPGGSPGGAGPGMARAIDELRAHLEVVGIEQSADRDGDEIAVGEIAGAVGIGEAPGLGQEMHGSGRGRPVGGEIEMPEQAQHLQQRRGARARRAHAAQAMGAVF